MGDGISNYERVMGLFRKNDPDKESPKANKKKKPKHRKKIIPRKRPPVFQKD